MTASEFYQLLKKKFPFELTLKQDVVIDQLSRFVFDDTPNALYLLKGFAGTGKTSLIGTLVSNLWETKKTAVLMAPNIVISKYKITILAYNSHYVPFQDYGT